MRGPRIKVLVVEDDADQLALRKMMLDRSGFEAIAVADTASALQAARFHHPACALLDLRLPSEEDGLMLIRELRREEPRIHIVVYTGVARARLEQHPEMSLVDAVIEKGSSASKMIQKLRHIERLVSANTIC